MRSSLVDVRFINWWVTKIGAISEDTQKKLCNNNNKNAVEPQQQQKLTCGNAMKNAPRSHLKLMFRIYPVAYRQLCNYIWVVMSRACI